MLLRASGIPEKVHEICGDEIYKYSKKKQLHKELLSLKKY